MLELPETTAQRAFQRRWKTGHLTRKLHSGRPIYCHAVTPNDFGQLWSHFLNCPKYGYQGGYGRKGGWFAEIHLQSRTSVNKIQLTPAHLAGLL